MQAQVLPITRVCCVCNVAKDTSEFFKDKKSKTGFSYCCKECSAKRTQKWRGENRAKLNTVSKIRAKNYYKKNPEKYLKIKRKYILKSKYGVTEKEIIEKIKKQNNCCEICKTPFPNKGRNKFNIDHCHETGQVRGILCARCNPALGAFRDSPELLEAAAAYIRHYRSLQNDK